MGVGGGALSSSDGTREWFDEIPEKLLRTEPDTEWSRKVDCSCGLHLPIRAATLLGYMEAMLAAGLPEVELTRLIRLHHGLK